MSSESLLRPCLLVCGLRYRSGNHPLSTADTYLRYHVSLHPLLYARIRSSRAIVACRITSDVWCKLEIFVGATGTCHARRCVVLTTQQTTSNFALTRPHRCRHLTTNHSLLHRSARHILSMIMKGLCSRGCRARIRLTSPNVLGPSHTRAAFISLFQS